MSIHDLPHLSSQYSLTEDQVESFQRNGHIYLPQVCSTEEVNIYQKIICNAAEKSFTQENGENRPFVQTINLRYHCHQVMKFVLANRFGQIVSDLISSSTKSTPAKQSQSVRIFYDKALFKEPRSIITPWHQDMYYWPLVTQHAVSMWMPLIDIPLEMGPIRFASESHHQGFVKPVAISDQSQSFFQQWIEDEGYPVWQRSMKAGDATFHNGWTIHGSTANQTDHMRQVMIVTYYPDGTVVDKLSNPSRIHDAKHFLGGKNAGDLADSQMNPLIYQAS